ncbi:MAG: ABC transporter substrate-binding protein [Planctomycetota bacterium]
MTDPYVPRRYPAKRMWVWNGLVLASLLVLIQSLAGCGESGGSESERKSERASPTVVSLSPAATQMLIDMGKRDHLIAVSRDDADGLGLPTCGTYNLPDYDRILALSPDIVITQPHKDGPAPKLQRLADDGVFRLCVLPHARSVDDVSEALTHDEWGLGVVMGDAAAATAAERKMRQQLDAVAAVVSDRGRPRVLLLLNPGTLGVIGPNTTHDELLHLAGGVNAATPFESSYLQLSREQVQTIAKPDLVLLIQPNGQPLAQNDDWLEMFDGLTVPAVTNRRFVVITHPQASLPATSIPAVVTEMAAAIHPEDEASIRRAYELAGRADGQTP